MKKLNEGSFLHAKSETCDNELRTSDFPSSDRKYPLPPSNYSTPPIKDNLPFGQPTCFPCHYTPTPKIRYGRVKVT